MSVFLIMEAVNTIVLTLLAVSTALVEMATTCMKISKIVQVSLMQLILYVQP